jgi:tetratricopeptide (TPR) repeat protein
LQNKQFSAALQTTLKTYNFFKTIQDPYYTAIEAANLAEAYFETGDYENAQQYAYAALEQEEKLAYPYALFTLGRVKGVHKAWEEAEAHFIESARIAQHSEDFYMVAYAQRGLAEAYWQNNKHFEAKQILNESLRGFVQLGMANEIEKNQQMLHSLCAIPQG